MTTPENRDDYSTKPNDRDAFGEDVDAGEGHSSGAHVYTPSEGDQAVTASDRAAGDWSLESRGTEDPAFEDPVRADLPLGDPALDKPGLDKPGLDKPGLDKPALGDPALETSALGGPVAADPAASGAAPRAFEARVAEERWRDLQSQFVDDPAAAVDSAVRLLKAALDDLNREAADGGARSTEDLRVAFMRYREVHRALIRS